VIDHSMSEILRHFARHGYSVLFVSVFARQVCLPVPAILFLMAGGALAGNGRLSLPLVVGLGAVAAVLADLLWYLAGRLRGDDVLHWIQRFSSTTDANASRTKQLFTRFGTKVLLISKFVLGLDAIAPPLAGMSGTSASRFVAFDSVGSALWAGVYVGIGYAFRQELDKGVVFAGRIGAVLTAAVLLLFAILIARRLVTWYRLIRELRMTRISSEQLKGSLDRGESPLILDVQGCLLHRASGQEGIPGAIRIDGRRLGRYKDSPIPDPWRGRDVVIYCSCPNEVTSARVARLLLRKGVKQVRPLAGGLQGWRARGFPVCPVAARTTHTAATATDSGEGLAAMTW